MSNVSKVSIALTSELNELIQNAVASGAYASASEVVREALRDWEDKQLHKKEQLALLRKMVQDGINSGPSVAFSVEGIKQRGRKRLAKMNKKTA